MKKLTALLLVTIIVYSCENNNNSNNETNTSTDSLATNPHAIPSHVDTITHEDGLTNQSPVNTDTAVTKEKVDSSQR